MSWARLSMRRAIGIDLGARVVKAAQLARTAGGWRVTAAACIPRAVPGDVPEPFEVARLVGVLSRQGFVGDRVAVAVPPDKLLRGVLELPPPESGAPLGRIARMEMARMHGCDPQSFEMAWWPLPRSQKAQAPPQVQATACAHAVADPLLDVLEAEGLDVAALSTEACALARACGHLLGESDDIGVIVDLGWTACRTIVLCRGAILYERSVREAGISRLMAVLARQTQLGAEELDAVIARASAQGSDAPPEAGGLHQAALDTIAGHFEQAQAELQAPLAYVLGQYPGRQVRRVLLVGGGASLPGVRRKLAEILQAEAQVVAAGDLAEWRTPPRDACTGASLAAAVGLAMSG